MSEEIYRISQCEYEIVANKEAIIKSSSEVRGINDIIFERIDIIEERMEELIRMGEEKKMDYKKVLALYHTLRIEAITKEEQDGLAKIKEVMGKDLSTMREEFRAKVIETILADADQYVYSVSENENKEHEPNIKITIEGLGFRNPQLTEEGKNIISKSSQLREDLQNLLARCEALLDMCTTREEANEVLIAYKIIDKNHKILA